MESDFINIVNELLRQEDNDLPARLESQEETLKELECIDPILGNWFENTSVPYVLSAFKLSDKDFATAFPRLKKVTTAQREQIVHALEHHLEGCPRCSRRRSYDLEFEARVESSLMRNKDFLLEQLDNEDGDKPSEEKHIDKGRARSAHR